jgi:hypothetical protein
VVLVAGHGRGAVFHDDQGQVVAVEDGVDDARQAAWKKVESPMKATTLRVSLNRDSPDPMPVEAPMHISSCPIGRAAGYPRVWQPMSATVMSSSRRACLMA